MKIMACLSLITMFIFGHSSDVGIQFGKEQIIEIEPEEHEQKHLDALPKSGQNNYFDHYITLIGMGFLIKDYTKKDQRK
ncbi:MAG TPA: hypothetical protein VIG45_01130 [Erysipelothrix sp.]